jgi:hypothetical protein
MPERPRASGSEAAADVSRLLGKCASWAARGLGNRRMQRANFAQIGPVGLL